MPRHRHSIYALICALLVWVFSAFITPNRVLGILLVRPVTSTLLNVRIGNLTLLFRVL
ncbi:hypothetical protein M3J09_007430 [Ascochyta lentis]